MRVLYIYDGDWPKGATRVKKETRSLAAVEHNVLLICRNAARDPREEEEDWMTVRRLPSVPGDAFNQAVNFPLPISPVWAHAIWKACRDFRPDAILVEDLPLAPMAIAIGKCKGLPVLYDMGEVYPEFLRGMKRFRSPSLSDRILRNPGPAEFLEAYVLRNAAHTFVVSEESRDRAVERGADPQRISIVGNTPEDPEDLLDSRPMPDALQALGDRPILLFVGIFIADRGLRVAVQAMDSVRERFPDAALVLVGDGVERSSIEREIARLSLSEHVFLTGWQEHSSLPGFYQHADVGLLPFLDGGQIRYTLANKLFDYMAASLPVVATDVPPMRRVLSEADVGELVEAGNARSLADGIVRMLSQSPAHRSEMGAAGQELVMRKYNWENDSARLLAGLERAVREHGSSKHRLGSP